MTLAERLERLEAALERWLRPDEAAKRIEAVLSELRSVGAPIGHDCLRDGGVMLWIDCTREQADAYDRKKAELRARGFGDVLDEVGHELLVIMPNEGKQLPPGNSKAAQPAATIRVTPSNRRHSDA